jgi:F-type H+-transporting ATPase subunit b
MLTFPPDISFVVQIVSFLVLWFGLKRLLFDPALQVLEERERRTVGERHAADGLRTAAEGSAEDYQRRMHEIRVKLAADADATFKAIEAEERTIVSDAREQANAQLMQLRERLGRQAAEARPALASEAQTLSRQMLEQVLGRPVA